ncbi:AraC family transcriptional regulator [Hoeflea poritis]|uniref:Helix-turn-helix transcriptional regulator n=1 Tax=Hoeflea poritis TaxID=2993659 RepID=A0ABT4VVV5_9HYPH|nr:AraC family transcriptional regulator [Hoeflea poritis]MDA4848852.1 helix-turn-helix transcriptional regulator [Hoeflea poritis]
MISSISDAFRRHFAVPCVTALDDVGAFFSKRSGVYHVEQRGKAADDTAELSLAAIDDMPLIWSMWSAPAESVSQTSRGKLCINVVLNGVTEAIHPDLGLITANQDIARVSTMVEGTRLINRSSKETLELAIPIEQLTARARSLFGRDTDGLIQFEPTLNLKSPRGLTILQLLAFLQTNCVYGEKWLKSPIVLANTKELIFMTVLGTLPNNFQSEMGAAREFALPGAVARAEEYMRSHANRPLTVEAIARKAGCSERALQDAFRRVRDTTPMAMLRDIRLEHARADLQNGLVSVTDCALSWGFSNLGRFTKHYQKKYGEKPSDTVRR